MASVNKREWTYKGETKTAWIVRYFDQKGIRRQKTFDKKKDADKFRTKVESEIENGTHTPDAEAVTVSWICDEFIRRSEDRMKHGSIGRNRYISLKIHIDKSIIPHLGKYKLPDLTPQIIEDWFTTIIRGDGLNPRTARDRLQTLKLIETFAVRRGHLKKRITADALSAAKGIKRAKIRTFTAEQIKQLLITASQRGAHKHRPAAMMNCFVNIAVFCGLRLGEIKALTLGNVDLDRRIIKVRHSLPHWDELKEPKTAAGVRDVPVPMHVVQIVREWVARYYIPNDRDLIFRTAKGSIPQNDNIQEMWQKLLARAGIADDGEAYHFHALRHFAGSWMIHNGMDLMTVAMRLGHEKFDMTLQVYAHPIMGSAPDHEVAERLAGGLLTHSPALIDARVTQQSLTH